MQYTTYMKYYLFVDDERNPSDYECVDSGVDPTLPWVVVRSSLQAFATVLRYGIMPAHIALDYHLGTSDVTLNFLRELKAMHEDDDGYKGQPMPTWSIHTADSSAYFRLSKFMSDWENGIANDD